MQIDNGSNSYTHLRRYQQPVPPQPLDEKPVTIPEYEPPRPSPEKVLETKEKIGEKIGSALAEEEAQRDDMRRLTVAYMGLESKRAQWENYMEGQSDDRPSGVEFYDTIREIRERNNRVRVYAAYMEEGLKAPRTEPES
ncbi:hypothetical protein [Hydrogenimonas sp.]